MTESTVVIYDPFFVVPRDKPGVEQYGIGATQGAIEAFGKTQGANVIALGALSELTGVITLENLKHEIETGPTKRFKDSNLKAMNISLLCPICSLFKIVGTPCEKGGYHILRGITALFGDFVSHGV